jgi:thiol-disulfide isomerase/thioredoxin
LPAKPEKPVLLGDVTREQVEAAVPDWVQAEVEAAPDPAAVKALAAAPPGAEVTIYMGSWCGDSRRELARLWRAMDEAGGSLPCAIRYIGVDHDKKEPAALLAGSGVRYVPTLIVKRDGREVGRIVESSPHGVEQDLLALLDGHAHGVVTAKAELQPDKPQRPPEQHR